MRAMALPAPCLWAPLALPEDLTSALQLCCIRSSVAVVAVDHALAAVVVDHALAAVAADGCVVVFAVAAPLVAGRGAIGTMRSVQPQR